MLGLARRAADAIDRVSTFVGYSCAVLYFACILLSAAEVVLRYGFNAPTSWSFETIMAICATAWVLSAGYVTVRRRHIAITVLELLVPKRVWRVFRLIQMIVAVLAVSVLIWALWGPAVTAVSTVERSGSAFNPPLPAYLKAIFVVGCVLYVLQLFANLVHWFDGTEPEAASDGH